MKQRKKHYIDTETDEELTTWVIKEHLLLIDEYQRFFIKAQVDYANGYEATVMIPADKFAHVMSFNSFGAQYLMNFRGGHAQLQELLDELTQDCGPATLTSDMVGILKDEWFDWNNPAFFHTNNHPLRQKFEVNPETNPLEIDEFLRRISQVFPDQMPQIFGWFCAAPLTSKIRTKFELMPLLVVNGEQGCGKTDIIILINQAFGWKGDLESFAESEYMLTRLMSCTNAVPICLDEFRNELVWKLDILKLVPKGACWTKGHWTNQGPSQVEMRLVAPVCLVGEDIPNSQALLERILHVELQKNKRLPITLWDRVLNSKTNLSAYMEWAASQQIPKSSEFLKPKINFQRLRREEMGILVANLGLEMFARWAKAIGAEVPERFLSTIEVVEETHDLKPQADDTLIFIEQLFVLYDSGIFNNTELKVEEIKGTLHFKMQDAWWAVKQHASRIGFEVKGQRELNKMLAQRKWAKGPKQKFIKGAKVLCWSIERNVIDEILNDIRSLRWKEEKQ